MNKIVETIERIKDFINEYAYKIIISLVSACAILILAGFWLIRGSNLSADNNGEPSGDQSNKVTSTESNDSGEVYVDVKGEVKHPGMYKLNSGSRVNDAIKQAEGFTKNADQSSINLAQNLSDEEVIVVDNYKNHKKNTQNSFSNASSNNSESGKIHLNSADTTELQKLDRVGAKTAQKIVDFRNENHGFKNIEEIKQVSGLGDKSYERLKDSVTL